MDQELLAFLLQLVRAACATCGALDGQSMDTLNLVLGGGAGIGAAAAAGANMNRDAWTFAAAHRGSGFDDRLHAKGRQHEHWGEGGTVEREHWRNGPTPTVLDTVDHWITRIARANQRWAESIVGPDSNQTVPSSGKG